MSVWMRRTAAIALTAALCGGSLSAADVEKKSTPAFGVLQAPAPDAAKAQALDWLKAVGKTDAASLQTVNAVWASDRPLLDKVSATFAQGNADAAKLLAEAANPDSAAPMEPPALISDEKQTPYFRANFALAYARALSIRHVHEQVLDTLKGVRAEQTVDPATYFFTKAVSEHALIQKDQALDSIDHLLSDVSDAPERYRTVGALMVFDMMNWKDGGKDLASRLDPLTRKMKAVKDRLDLSRGGDKTQKMEKEIVFRMEEVIKELENQQKNGGKGGNSGNCPNGGNAKGDKPNDNTQASRPQDDSLGGNGKGKGEIDMKKLNDTAAKWGKLPEKDRADAMKDLTRDLSPELRDTVERFFKELSSRSLAEDDSK
jgi:hypothetical protein